MDKTEVVHNQRQKEHQRIRRVLGYSVLASIIVHGSLLAIGISTLSTGRSPRNKTEVEIRVDNGQATPSTIEFANLPITEINLSGSGFDDDPAPTPPPTESNPVASTRSPSPPHSTPQSEGLSETKPAVSPSPSSGVPQSNQSVATTGNITGNTAMTVPGLATAILPGTAFVGSGTSQREGLPSDMGQSGDQGSSVRGTGLGTATGSQSTQGKGSGSHGNVSNSGAKGNPVCLMCPKPRYRGSEGSPRVTYDIAPDGRVINVQLRQSSGDPLTDRETLDALSRWRFDPNTIGGGRQGVRIRVTFEEEGSNYQRQNQHRRQQQSQPRVSPTVNQPVIIRVPVTPEPSPGV
ncbi:MAG: TonB family protein [Synechococcales bacterium]|nr:TonB family protein [Cyanobacteria bacterium REEB444]MEB3125887.1 TonB family protein [Synechococcales bacterium]